LSLPGSANLESEEIEVYNDGNYDIYVRCKDANGNTNIGTYVFKFCMDKGPDTTPPIIVSTNLLRGMPFAFNETPLDIDLDVYVNEHAECSWSRDDKDYEDMEEEMNCSNSYLNMDSQLVYTCQTTLTGLKNRENNDFYFRCKDQPGIAEEERNKNKQSYKFTLIGTQPLIISAASPNDTIVKDASDPVKVTLEVLTAAGFNSGESTCYYNSYAGDEESYISFLNTGSAKHSQDLYLEEGSHEFYIKCVDLGGNQDLEIITFEVDSDTESPIVTRAYHEEAYLKIITDEKSECVYDTFNCMYAFEDGIKLTAVDELTHYTDWSTTSTQYIKCKDIYENQPSHEKCTTILRPIEIVEEK